MLANAPILVIALASALIVGQVPEFMQQYGQRLGGAVDEVARIVGQFDEDSRRSGYERPAALALMAKNAERLIRDQASRMEANISRLNQLRHQQDTFKNSGSVTRLSSFLTNYDRPLAERTFEAFKPALPITFDGLLFAAAGFLIPCFASIAGSSRRRRNWEVGA
jgi:hypothetical protein